ncbi:NAD-binding protein [Fomitiporia mediterranea MF3/22]|uniref:NAD-binding protein n=1 Tax=Fomitiporia mediterranea (strain MF3/22) TaxID=694068 RepID=UPI00044073B6|nr:NAD-binding protein [Fomitiporia mediterranea MF3/22]EJD01060.1 NAD-binding protein [Fomitiporia mediterranea MF3/22]
MSNPFILVTPSTRGLSLALTRHFLKTTKLPVYATHRTGTAEEHHKNILSPLSGIDSNRLKVLPLDLRSETRIQDAADALKAELPDKAYLHTGFFTGGMLYPEKNPKDINDAILQETFQVNVLSHLLLIKHFSQFLPDAKMNLTEKNGGPTKWVHVTARVGSISDNKRGGWYSYRASKAALNQVIKTFDNQLAMNKTPSICVGVHPGTVKTDLSKDFWSSVPKEELFEPENAAERLVDVVGKLTEEHRGKVWDYAGKQVPCWDFPPISIQTLFNTS